MHSATMGLPPGRELHDGYGALAHERDGHWMGADAVARDAAGGAGGAEEEREWRKIKIRSYTNCWSVLRA